MIVVLATPHAADNPSTPEALAAVVQEAAQEAGGAPSALWALTGQSKAANALPEATAGALGVPFRGFAVDWRRNGRPAAKLATRAMLEALGDAPHVVVGAWDGQDIGCAVVLALALSTGRHTVGFLVTASKGDAP